MPKRNIRKKRNRVLEKTGLTKKDSSHLKEFGELHPAFESSSEDESQTKLSRNVAESHSKINKRESSEPKSGLEKKSKQYLEKIESILKVDSEAVSKCSYEELLDCLSSADSDSDEEVEANDNESGDEQESSDSDEVNDEELATDQDEDANLADVDLDSADEAAADGDVDLNGDAASESSENAESKLSEEDDSDDAASESSQEPIVPTKKPKRKRTASPKKKKKRGKVISAFKRHLETELSKDTLENLRSGASSKQTTNGQLETFKWTYAGLKDAASFVSDANLLDPFGALACRATLRDAAFCWNASHGSLRVSFTRDSPLSLPQRELASLLFNYADIYYAPHRTSASNDHRLVYTLHALSHVLRSRNLVMKHNLRLRTVAEARARLTQTQLRKEKRAKRALGVTNVTPVREYRDQQFTRPKVLILVPFRESVRRIVTLICELLAGGIGDQRNAASKTKDEAEEKSDRSRIGKIQVLNKRRFLAEFSDPDADSDAAKSGSKPADYTETFAGNTDDHFRLGISVKKRSVRLYSEFYGSDIIIASPLGLRTLISPNDADGEDVEEQEKTPRRGSTDDSDFLSSVEMLVIDQADVIEMQNLEHLHYVLDRLNQMPRDSHGTDLSRVRMWTLDGASRFYRQTVVFSAQPTIDTLGAFYRNSSNYEGRFVLLNEPRVGSLAHVLVPHRHVFLRVPCSSFADAADARFEYFVNELLPRWFDSSSGSFERQHVLVFVSSYFDYVRLRNHFRRADANVALLSEYADSDSVMTARGLFYAGRVPLALYTERMHFYHRYRIRGVRHVIFYQLPRYPQFYAEACNWLLDPSVARRRGKSSTTDVQERSASGTAPDDCSITVLFNRYDRYQLEGVLGYERAVRMIDPAASASEHSGNTFVYYAAK